jgi:hypothetical protein
MMGNKAFPSNRLIQMICNHSEHGQSPQAINLRSISSAVLGR